MLLIGKFQGNTGGREVRKWSRGAIISTKDLRTIARARLRDAQVLLNGKRFDGAFYISGYAVELALKARICRTLKWPDFPQSGREFVDFRSLRTHSLEVLLKFSGVEERVTAKHAAEWTVVVSWDPEKRYQAIGTLTPVEAEQMVKCAERLLEVL